MFAAVVRIAAAVYEAIGPALETMQKDMQNVKSHLASLNQRVDNLTEEVNSKLADVQRGLESKINDSMSDSFHNLFDLTTSELAIINSSMRDDLNCVKTELSRVNEIISDLGGHLQTHSQQTTSAVTILDTRLSSLNESMRDDLNSVKTELSRVNGFISDLGGQLQTHSQQTTSAVTKLDTRLSALNESMRDDFSG